MPTHLYLPMLLAMCSGAAIAQQSANPAASCYEGLSADARFAQIHDKVALGGTLDEMRRMTTSTERASAREAPVIAAWRNARDACHRMEKEYFAKRDATISGLALEHFAALQAMITELESGKLAYGEFGKRRLELYERTSSRIAEIRESIKPPRIIPHTVGK